MSLALRRIEQTRHALTAALAMRDWQAIGELDLACRACVDDVLNDALVDTGLLRSNLEGLLAVYRELLEATTNERRSLAAQLGEVNTGKKAMKVYQLFG